MFEFLYQMQLQTFFVLITCYQLDKYAVERIVILDFDFHHGMI